jgi:anti-sigma factor RsiW
MRNRGTCDGDPDLLNDYVDGRLRGAKLASVEKHLLVCERCRTDLNEIQALKRMLAADPVPQPSAEFWASCMEHAAAAGQPHRSRALRFRWPALGTALAGAVALLLWATVLHVPSVGPPAADMEIPHAELVMEHVGFEAAQPLGAGSHHILLTARGAESRSQLPTSDAAETPDDAAPSE